MKFNTPLLTALLISVFIIQTNAAKDQTLSNDSIQLTISFEFGKNLDQSNYTNIYTIWVENSDVPFIQNLKICQSLINGGLTNTALPFWNMNKRKNSSKTEIDAVTSATQKNRDFSVTASLKNRDLKKFTAYFEIDRSFEPNDWFSDQPAVLYAVDINLDDTMSTYELKPIGWTPNEGTENTIPSTPKGVLQKEMRYITHKKSGNSFGDADPRSLTSIVKKITVKFLNTTVKTGLVKKKVNSILSVNTNNGQIYFESPEIINHITFINIAGKTVFDVIPGTKQFTLDLCNTALHPGFYFTKIVTADGVKIRKVFIRARDKIS